MIKKTKKIPESHKIISEHIVSLLEKAKKEGKRLPWQIPWQKSSWQPVNIWRKRSYSRSNRFILNMTFQAYAYRYNIWGTEAQWHKLNLEIYPEQKSIKTPVISRWQVKEQIQSEYSSQNELIIDRSKINYLYNLDQIVLKNEIPRKVRNRMKMYENTSNEENKRVSKAEKIIFNYQTCPPIKNVVNRAYYRPKEDDIFVPDISNFIDTNQYYLTLFHEIVHSTGHFSRLNRHSLNSEHDTKDSYYNYSKEELVAELGACFLCGEAELKVHYLDSAAYIDKWLETLHKDMDFYYNAELSASIAVDYILTGKKPKIKPSPQHYVSKDEFLLLKTTQIPHSVEKDRADVVFQHNILDSLGKTTYNRVDHQNIEIISPFPLIFNWVNDMIINFPTEFLPLIDYEEIIKNGQFYALSRKAIKNRNHIFIRLKCNDVETDLEHNEFTLDLKTVRKKEIEIIPHKRGSCTFKFNFYDKDIKNLPLIGSAKFTIDIKADSQGYSLQKIIPIYTSEEQQKSRLFLIIGKTELMLRRYIYDLFRKFYQSDWENKLIAVFQPNRQKELLNRLNKDRKELMIDGIKNQINNEITYSILNVLDWMDYKDIFGKRMPSEMVNSLEKKLSLNSHIDKIADIRNKLMHFKGDSKDVKVDILKCKQFAEILLLGFETQLN